MLILALRNPQDTGEHPTLPPTAPAKVSFCKDDSAGKIMTTALKNSLSRLGGKKRETQPTSSVPRIPPGTPLGPTLDSHCSLIPGVRHLSVTSIPTPATPRPVPRRRATPRLAEGQGLVGQGCNPRTATPLPLQSWRPELGNRRRARRRPGLLPTSLGRGCRAKARGRWTGGAPFPGVRRPGPHRRRGTRRGRPSASAPSRETRTPGRGPG